MAPESGNPLAVAAQGAGKRKSKSGGFQTMGLSRTVLDNIKHMGYQIPTPIQRRAIPPILSGQDILAMARTGSGKTAAFLIPLVEKLKSHSARVGARAVVLSPSRELAMQTVTFLRKLSKGTDLRSVALVGGDSMDDQFSAMASNPDVIIATPGRLLHLLVEMEFDLKLVEYLVFDEADRLFDMGFEVQLHEILHRMPDAESRQTVLFSATLPKSVILFAKAGTKPDAAMIRLDTEIKIPKDLEMAFFTIKPTEKDAALLYLLREVIKLPKQIPSAASEADAAAQGKPKSPQAIVFVSTKHHVEYIHTLLRLRGYSSTIIYGALDQSVRKINLANFKAGRRNILVVTDVAARGIDIPILDHVINYDFPPEPKVFIHRVGRVARAGRRGWAWSMATSEEMPYLFDLQLFLGRPLIYDAHNNYPAELDYTNQIVAGAIPFPLIEDEDEWITQQLEENVELYNNRNTASNGYKLYNKTRVAASPESHSRYKTLTLSHPFGQGAHPLLLGKLSDADMKRQDLVAQLASFRPPETIFEVGTRGGKNEAHNLMQRRRVQNFKSIVKNREATTESAEAHRAAIQAAVLAAPTKRGADDDDDDEEDEEIKELLDGFAAARDPKGKKKGSKKQRTDNGPASADRFKDKEHFLEYRPADHNTERGYAMHATTSLSRGAMSASVDFMGDDDTMLRGTRGSGKMVWDAKKKKFRRETVGADNVKLIKGESGIKLPASLQAGRYTEWKKKNKMYVPRTGESELANSRELAAEARKRKFRHQPKEKTGTDLKDARQIVKQRKEKEQRKAKNARGPKRKGSGGGGGVSKGKGKSKGKGRK
ncbi:ATP-dependent RNA helicase dbp10 [Blastocladiella emersonii ATCC 22665]|nr:ATP-dependent RNA helicase dbp10 [Blastocladiella emersonii ATCC 22665]